MSGTARRFELLLPLHFQDGKPVPAVFFQQTIGELEAQFGALSAEFNIIRGYDAKSGEQQDKLIRVFVDAPPSLQTIGFFRQLKPRLEERFEQEEIRITHFLVEVV